MTLSVEMQCTDIQRNQRKKKHFVVHSRWSLQEAQLSQRDRAAACLNYGKNISAKSVHLGYFLKVQWQQCRARTI